MKKLAGVVCAGVLFCAAGRATAQQREAEAEGREPVREKSEDEAFLESVRAEKFRRFAPPEGVELLEDFVYASVGDRPLICDVYYREERPATPRPAIVFLHGGCWRFGNQKQFSRHAAYLALKHDFLAVSVDYRLSEEARFPAALQDAKCAIRWIRSKAKEYNIDPERIAVAGGSAGGHLAAMVATSADVPEYEGDGGHSEYPSHANLAIFLNGEFDLWDLVGKGSLIEAMELFLGGSPSEVPELYHEVSPIERVHKGVPPMLFLHGDQDRCVSHKQAIAMHRKLVDLGVPSEIEIYEGKPHAWFNSEPDFVPVLKRMEAFLVKHFDL